MPVWTFVRHGQSQANAEMWFAGHADAALTALGREQARAARAELTEGPLGRVYSSDLSRAHDTAKILLEGRAVEIRVTPRLRERTCGEWEGKPIEALLEQGALQVLEDFDGRPPGGESLRDLALRVLRFLDEIDDGTDAMLVCHGALMRCVIGLADARPKDQVGHWKPRNCEFVRRELPRGAWGKLLADVSVVPSEDSAAPPAAEDDHS